MQDFWTINSSTWKRMLGRRSFLFWMAKSGRCHVCSGSVIVFTWVFHFLLKFNLQDRSGQVETAAMICEFMCIVFVYWWFRVAIACWTSNNFVESFIWKHHHRKFLWGNIRELKMRISTSTRQSNDLNGTGGPRQGGLSQIERGLASKDGQIHEVKMCWSHSGIIFAIIWDPCWI